MIEINSIIIAMQPLLQHLCRILERMLQSTFPDNSYTPAGSTEQFCMPLVAINIFQELLHPEIYIGSGNCCVAAVFMPMPETTVDEYHCPEFWEHKIRRTRQSSHMKSIAKSLGKKKSAKRSLRLGILSSNARHHATALWGSWNAHGENLFRQDGWREYLLLAPSDKSSIRSDKGEFTMYLTGRRIQGEIDGAYS